jgi:putative tricarboxylic transport membrane protein
MAVLNNLAMGLINNFAGINSLYMIGGVMIGVVLGAIPGLTCGTAIALIIPMTYYMDTASAMVLILAIFVGGIYGGSISSILLGTPGTPASAATAMDGFPLAKQGKSGKALEAALIASATGTVFSALILIFFYGTAGKSRKDVRLKRVYDSNFAGAFHRGVCLRQKPGARPDVRVPWSVVFHNRP